MQIFAKVQNKRMQRKQGFRPRPFLSYLVLNILNHCNLNCKGCDHFAPLAEKRFVSLGNIIHDLKRLSDITDKSITRIGVMGGEPLLHPYLLDILTETRKAFPHTLIQLCTNGLLLAKMKDFFWRICHEYSIVIVTTKYPINLNFKKIEEKAASEKVPFEYFGDTGVTQKTSYKIPLDLNGACNPNESFRNCFHANNCLSFLMEGKIYPCTVAPNIHHFNKKFDTQLPLNNDDWLDIHQEKLTHDELLQFLATPIHFCRFCDVKNRVWGLRWELSKHKMSEWVTEK